MGLVIVAEVGLVTEAEMGLVRSTPGACVAEKTETFPDKL